ncbi:MAG: hypothetical protein ABIE74_00270 [Pseudomonadota bacterium]
MSKTTPIQIKYSPPQFQPCLKHGDRKGNKNGIVDTVGEAKGALGKCFKSKRRYDGLRRFLGYYGYNIPTMKILLSSFNAKIEKAKREKNIYQLCSIALDMSKGGVSKNKILKVFMTAIRFVDMVNDSGAVDKFNHIASCMATVGMNKKLVTRLFEHALNLFIKHPLYPGLRPQVLGYIIMGFEGAGLNKWQLYRLYRKAIVADSLTPTVGCNRSYGCYGIVKFSGVFHGIHKAGFSRAMLNSLFNLALSYVRKMDKRSDRERTINYLISKMITVGLYDRALKKMRLLPRSERWELMRKICFGLANRKRLRKALVIARSIEDHAEKSRSISHIASMMAKAKRGNKKKILALFNLSIKLAKKISYPTYKYEILSKIAISMARVGLFDKAISLTDGLQEYKEEALRGIVEAFVNFGLFDRAFTFLLSKKIVSQTYLIISEKAIGKLSAIQVSQLFTKALTFVEKNGDDECRGALIKQLLPYFITSRINVADRRKIFFKIVSLVKVLGSHSVKSSLINNISTTLLEKLNLSKNKLGGLFGEMMTISLGLGDYENNRAATIIHILSLFAGMGLQKRALFSRLQIKMVSGEYNVNKKFLCSVIDGLRPLRFEQNDRNALIKLLLEKNNSYSEKNYAIMVQLDAKHAIRIDLNLISTIKKMIAAKIENKNIIVILQYSTSDVLPNVIKKLLSLGVKIDSILTILRSMSKSNSVNEATLETLPKLIKASFPVSDVADFLNQLNKVSGYVIGDVCDKLSTFIKIGFSKHQILVLVKLISKRDAMDNREDEFKALLRCAEKLKSEKFPISRIYILVREMAKHKNLKNYDELTKTFDFLKKDQVGFGEIYGFLLHIIVQVGYSSSNVFKILPQVIRSLKQRSIKTEKLFSKLKLVASIAKDNTEEAYKVLQKVPAIDLDIFRMIQSFHGNTEYVYRILPQLLKVGFTKQMIQHLMGTTEYYEPLCKSIHFLMKSNVSAAKIYNFLMSVSKITFNKYIMSGAYEIIPDLCHLGIGQEKMLSYIKVIAFLIKQKDLYITFFKMLAPMIKAGLSEKQVGKLAGSIADNGGIYTIRGVEFVRKPISHLRSIGLNSEQIFNVLMSVSKVANKFNDIAFLGLIKFIKNKKMLRSHLPGFLNVTKCFKNGNYNFYLPLEKLGIDLRKCTSKMSFAREFVLKANSEFSRRKAQGALAAISNLRNVLDCISVAVKKIICRGLSPELKSYHNCNCVF